MKKLIAILSLILIIPLACANDARRHIDIIQTVSHPALDKTRQGLVDQLAQEGFIDGINIKIQFANAQGDLTLSNQIAQKFASQSPDVIVAIPTTAAQSAMAATRNKTIPVIFSSVTDPIDAGLVKNLNEPQGNITGVSNFIALDEQVLLYKMILPKMTKLGFIYNSGEANSAKILLALKKEAARQGIDIIAVTANKTTEVSGATRKLLSKNVDAIFISNDNTALSAFGVISKMGLQANIPIFVSDTDMVQHGALASLGPNQYTLGQQTGTMVAAVLNGKLIKDISVEFPTQIELVLNHEIAQKLQITFSEEVLNKALQQWI